MTIEYRLYLSTDAEPTAPTGILSAEFELKGGQDETIDGTVLSWVPDGPVSIKSRRLDGRMPAMAG